MEAEGLLEQDSVLHRPLVWERGEVGQICQRALDVVFVPEEHSQRLQTEGDTEAEEQTSAASPGAQKKRLKG